VDRWGRALGRVDGASRELRGKVSGAVGTRAALALACGSYEKARLVETSTLSYLGLEPATISTQIVHPEEFANYLFQIELAFGVMNDLANDMRQLQRPENRSALNDMLNRVTEIENDNVSRFPYISGRLALLKQRILALLQRATGGFDSYFDSYIVVRGDWLAKISGYPNIYNDYSKWPVIYRANQVGRWEGAKIRDPNLIQPGWTLRIPRAPLTEIVVVKGDWLSKISGWWEVYNDYTQWRKIYNANRSKISDPDLIKPGWTLTIPQTGTRRLEPRRTPYRGR